jgi:hypothetical protein
MAKTVATKGNVVDLPVTADPVYGNLSEDGKSDWDSCLDLGFKPYRATGGLWFAHRTGKPGVDEIGPSESLSVLFTMVEDYAADDTVKTREVVLDADADGNPFLPGAEEILTEVDIPELREPALNYHAFKTERIGVLAREVEAKEILDHLMHKHEAELPVDPETKTKYFKVGARNGEGRAVVIDLVKGSDKIKSRIVDEGEGV